MVPIDFALCKSPSDNDLKIPPPPPPPPPPPSDKGSATGMTDGAYQQVDEMPVYPGGDTALLKYLADSTHYPKDAKTLGIQGKVIVRFMVKADGSVSDVSVLKGATPSLDKESIRVVKTLPKFTPAVLKGKTVPVWYMIPIQFALK
jgi:protein TonB